LPDAAERAANNIRPLADALAPYFLGRPVTYVDAGAYLGYVYSGLRQAKINIRTAHLIEPSSVNFQQLSTRLDGVSGVTLHHAALGDAPGTAVLDVNDTMSRIVTGQASERLTETVPVVTLDGLLDEAGIDHVDLLKIDVEGSEIAVLRGARRLLQDGRVDVVYIEAGMAPDGLQQVSHRLIEDELESFGYRLLGIFEQTHEWLTDGPTLRRANLAFVSAQFAASHPYRLSRALVKQSKLSDALRAERDAAVQQLAAYEAQEHAAAAQAATERAAADSRIAQLESELGRAREARAASDARADQLVDWAVSLERVLRSVLRSRWWKISLVGLKATRTARRLVGAKLHPLPSMPPRPRVGNRWVDLQPRDAVVVAPDTVERVRVLARRGRIVDLSRLVRRLGEESASESGWIKYAYGEITAAMALTVYVWAVRIADAIVARYGAIGSECIGVLGDVAYVDLVDKIASAYTRVGRLEDADTVLTVAIGLGHDSLLRPRGQIRVALGNPRGIDDLESAVARDVEAGLVAELPLAFIRAIIPDGSPRAVEIDGSVDTPAVELARVISRRRAGDTGGERAAFNRFFERSGLAPAYQESGVAATFADLGKHVERPERSPHEQLVTVIMTSFDAAATIEQAIESILEQTHREIELIVVDDVSSDATRAIVSDIAARDSRVRLMVRTENAGTYVAKNAAIGEAKGEFITFLDSDDWAHPQRIERHLDAMHADPNLLVTRSAWFRMQENGELFISALRPSTENTVIHANPAATFVRREVFDRVGLFDELRFGADTEWWNRARRALPAGSRGQVREVLTIGRQRDDSLTQSGAGAFNGSRYNPARSAYAASWRTWHPMHSGDELALPVAGVRPLWAPMSMMASAASGPTRPGLAALAPLGDDDPQFFFVISFIAPEASHDWSQSVQLLGRTLDSLLGQTDPRWRAIICGHRPPPLPALDDPRVTFIKSDRPPATVVSQFRSDKLRKRQIAAAHVRALGGGYIFMLDADDLVHRDVVQHVLADDNRRGYVVRSGFVEDFRSGAVSPVPGGAWSLDYDRICGSSTAIWFDAEDLPVRADDAAGTYFDMFRQHAYWAVTAEEFRGKLEPIPFAAGIYSLNHGENISMQDQRNERRRSNIIEAINRTSIDAPKKLLVSEFGQHAPAVDAPAPSDQSPA
jgi:FkbM family methyltransferase